ncbi:hypothetical protein FDENT_5735 [Fusarium denticulatum]|uniref:Uncharacterized protein n=1 Tax=Fusarium denticulatum TaxID=48507 RepID=A0A8H5X8L9_9HYPO|nr:hypothetical protein FDENT_5735 [Fusarium denticulatum]
MGARVAVVVGSLGCGDVLLDLAVFLYQLPVFQSVQLGPSCRVQNSESLQHGSRHDKNIASVPEPEHSHYKVGPDYTESCGADIAHKTEQVAFGGVWEPGDFQQKIRPSILLAASRSTSGYAIVTADLCVMSLYMREEHQMPNTIPEIS